MLSNIRVVYNSPGCLRSPTHTQTQRTLIIFGCSQQTAVCGCVWENFFVFRIRNRQRIKRIRRENKISNKKQTSEKYARKWRTTKKQHQMLLVVVTFKAVSHRPANQQVNSSFLFFFYSSEESQWWYKRWYTTHRSVCGLKWHIHIHAAVVVNGCGFLHQIRLKWNVYVHFAPLKLQVFANTTHINKCSPDNRWFQLLVTLEFAENFKLEHKKKLRLLEKKKKKNARSKRKIAQIAHAKKEKKYLNIKENYEFLGKKCPTIARALRVKSK